VPFFLVTNVCDEGVHDTSFRVIEAPSRLAVAEHILRDLSSWAWWLRRSCILDGIEKCSAAQLLARIDETRVDGDSEFQFAIQEVKTIEKC
jgi:hypothetical protein